MLPAGLQIGGEIRGVQDASHLPGDLGEGGALLRPKALGPVPVADAQNANLPAAVDRGEILDRGDRTARFSPVCWASGRARGLDGGVRKRQDLAHRADEIRQRLVGGFRCGDGHADAAHHLIGIPPGAEQHPVHEALEPRPRSRQDGGDRGGQQRRVPPVSGLGPGNGQQSAVDRETEPGQAQVDDGPVNDKLNVEQAVPQDRDDDGQRDHGERRGQHVVAALDAAGQQDGENHEDQARDESQQQPLKLRPLPAAACRCRAAIAPRAAGAATNASASTGPRSRKCQPRPTCAGPIPSGLRTPSPSISGSGRNIATIVMAAATMSTAARNRRHRNDGIRPSGNSTGSIVTCSQ